MIRRNFLYAAAAFAPLFGAASGRAFAQAEPPTTIRFAAQAGDDLRPVLYALSTGMFKQAGLDVVMQTGNGSTTAQAVIGGAVDIGKGTITAMIAAHARGIPVVLITPSMIYRKDSPTSGVIVATASPLRTGRDLQGKVVGCSALGGIAYLGLRSLVDQQGGDSSLIKFIEMPGSATPAAVEAGRIDAGVTEEPFMSVFFTTRDFASKHPEAVARFAKVVQDAAKYTNTHAAETLPLFVQLSGMDPRLAAQIHHSFTPVSFNAAQIQPVIELAAKYKAIPASFDARELLAQ
jgi:NitT/TauT family transport system substrate-binding protein